MLLLGDSLHVLPTLPPNSVDSIVTDPPAGISFMSLDWDSDKGGRDQWIAWLTDVMKECLRIVKPGGHALVWALPRTSHWTMTAIENAGFEVRDVVSHIFATGFPKSLDVSRAIDQHLGVTRTKGAREWTGGRRTGCIANSPKTNLGTQTLIKYDTPATPEAEQWRGFGTNLKPACEFWILARKPLSEPTVAANVLKWGTGAINIDGCRIPTEGRPLRTNPDCERHNGVFQSGFQNGSRAEGTTTKGRWPANVLFDEPTAALLDAQTGILTSGKPSGKRQSRKGFSGNICIGSDLTGYGDSGGASRFFQVIGDDPIPFIYMPKASSSERNLGIPKVYDLKPDTPPDVLDRIKTYLEAMK